MRQKLQATPASEWRRVRQEGILVPLPSGKVAALRNVNMAMLMASDLMSDVLSPIVLDVLHGKQQKLDKMSPEKVIEANIAIQDKMCELAFVVPRVVSNPQSDDEISLDDLSDMDKEAVMHLLYSPVEVLAEKLFQKQNRTVEPVEQGETLQTSAQ